MRGGGGGEGELGTISSELVLWVSTDCRLVLLLHEKDSSAGKKELAFLSMHEL